MGEKAGERRKESARRARGYSYTDAAQFLKVSVRTVMRWVVKGCLPSPEHKDGRTAWNAEQWFYVVGGPRLNGTFEYRPTNTALTARRAAARSETLARPAARNRGQKGARKP